MRESVYKLDLAEEVINHIKGEMNLRCIRLDESQEISRYLFPGARTELSLERGNKANQYFAKIKNHRAILPVESSLTKLLRVTRASWVSGEKILGEEYKQRQAEFDWEEWYINMNMMSG